MSTTHGSSNYEYVTARVRTRRAVLFDDDDYRKLVRMGTGEIARFMEDTEYEAEMDALGSRYSGVDLIEYALNRNLAKHFEDLLRWSDGQLFDLVARYLRKFDVWNVKTVLRGIYADVDTATIEDDLIHAGELSESLLTKMVGANSIQEAVESLDSTVFGDELAVAYADFESTDTLVPLENAVDRAYYDLLTDGLASEGQADSATGMYVEFVRAEVDFRNLRNALRLAQSHADIDPSKYYIDGGRLFDEATIRQLAGKTDQIVQAVRESAYGGSLEDALDALATADDLVSFEHALDTALLEYAGRLSNRYPLSICPVLSYVLAKEREVDNVRAIARGREAGLDGEAIEQEFVIR